MVDSQILYIAACIWSTTTIVHVTSLDMGDRTYSSHRRLGLGRRNTFPQFHNFQGGGAKSSRFPTEEATGPTPGGLQLWLAWMMAGYNMYTPYYLHMMATAYGGGDFGGLHDIMGFYPQQTPYMGYPYYPYGRESWMNDEYNVGARGNAPVPHESQKSGPFENESLRSETSKGNQRRTIAAEAAPLVYSERRYLGGDYLRGEDLTLCADTCHGMEEGVYRSCDSCDSYVVCWWQEEIHKRCDLGMAFDLRSQQCATLDVVDCQL